MSESNEEQKTSGQEPDCIHIQLDFNNEIMTCSHKKEECHPQAKYWFPVANYDRLLVYLRIASINKVETKEHFTRLLVNRIVQQVR